MQRSVSYSSSRFCARAARRDRGAGERGAERLKVRTGLRHLPSAPAAGGRARSRRPHLQPVAADVEARMRGVVLEGRLRGRQERVAEERLHLLLALLLLVARRALPVLPLGPVILPAGGGVPVGHGGGGGARALAGGWAAIGGDGGGGDGALGRRSDGFAVRGRDGRDRQSGQLQAVGGGVLRCAAVCGARCSGRRRVTALSVSLLHQVRCFNRARDLTGC